MPKTKNSVTRCTLNYGPAQSVSSSLLLPKWEQERISKRSWRLCTILIFRGNRLMLTQLNGTPYKAILIIITISIKPADKLVVNIEFLNKLTVHIFRLVNLNSVNQGIEESLRKLVNVRILLD